ncbi:hypothetical protein B0H11DRAFT_2072704 [Mycena galericulata]|nr:hypothetical protein B0H11DRAFT_2072704 [Mycena galericulata]
MTCAPSTVLRDLFMTVALCYLITLGLLRCRHAKGCGVPHVSALPRGRIAHRRVQGYDGVLARGIRSHGAMSGPCERRGSTSRRGERGHATDACLTGETTGGRQGEVIFWAGAVTLLEPCAMTKCLGDGAPLSASKFIRIKKQFTRETDGES